MPADDRPKYSTGFKLFVFGWLMIGLGLLLATKVWGPLWVICILGFPGIWFKYPSDWRKTWPEDFPTTARVLGKHVESPADDQASTNWWDTAPASSRQRFALFTIVGGAGLFIWGLTQPTNFHGYPSHLEGLLVGPIIAWFGLTQFRRANSDRS